MKPIDEPVGLIRVCFSAVGLFLGWKLKISHEQNVNGFSILHTHAKFQASRLNNKKKNEGSLSPCPRSTLYGFISEINIIY